jgi:putative toxin-antitoxin system antitoxin component (TIGR02293 family)
MEPARTEVTRDVERFREFLHQGMPGPHAYAVLLGLTYYDFPSLRKAIEKGLPWKSFDRFVRNIGLPADTVATMIAIRPRTLARRKAEGRFTSEESDRLLRAARVYAKSLDLFDGDAEAARLWLTDLNTALGGVAPIEFARTEMGAQEVEDLIGRIQHGVFS